MGERAPRWTSPPAGRAADPVDVLQAFAAHDITPVGLSLTEEEASAFAARHLTN